MAATGTCTGMWGMMLLIGWTRVDLQTVPAAVAERIVIAKIHIVRIANPAAYFHSQAVVITRNGITVLTMQYRNIVRIVPNITIVHLRGIKCYARFMQKVIANQTHPTGRIKVYYR